MSKQSGKIVLYGQTYYIKTIRNEGENLIITCSPEMKNLTDEIDIAINKFITARREQFPRFPTVMNATLDKAKITVLAIMNKYGEDPADIVGVINHAINDNFWKRNLMTLTALDGICTDKLTKYEHIKMNWIKATEQQEQREKDINKAQGFSQTEEGNGLTESL